MSATSAHVRDKRGEWSPEQPVALAPINHWPLQPRALMKWFVGFPGYLWPYNGLWFAITIVTWFFLTPPLAAMQTLEVWWVAWILARNLLLVSLVFGTLHAWLYIYKRQGEELQFSNRGPARDSRRFLFRDQVKDNVFFTLASAVPIATAYEVLTYWLYANGYLGWLGLEDSPVLFWALFIGLVLIAPVIHSFHFYFGHRLLHVPFLYKRVHSLHHKNVEIGPWSGLAMHPVEHAIYLSTPFVQWLVALHPLNALFQLQLAVFLPALSHSGFQKLKVGDQLEVDGGCHFHYLHHRYFECNYGGSLIPLDKWFGTFHDGTPEGQAATTQRLRKIRGLAPKTA
ncbi:MAG: sterol desaturase family protein [Pseudomonadota bacterium]